MSHSFHIPLFFVWLLIILILIVSRPPINIALLFGLQMEMPTKYAHAQAVSEWSPWVYADVVYVLESGWWNYWTRGLCTAHARQRLIWGCMLVSCAMLRCHWSTGEKLLSIKATERFTIALWARQGDNCVYKKINKLSVRIMHMIGAKCICICLVIHIYACIANSNSALLTIQLNIEWFSLN